MSATIFHPAPSRTQQPHDLVKNERYIPTKSLPYTEPATQPSDWKSTLRTSICCVEPPSPNSVTKPSPENGNGKESYAGRNDYVVPSWSSSLDDYIQSSDTAHEDVYTQLRTMSNDVDACIQARPRPQPQQRAARPDSQAISEMDSHASLPSVHSVSDLGAESEPGWFAGIIGMAPWAKRDTMLASRTPATKRTAWAEKDGYQWEPVRGAHRKKQPEATTVRPVLPSQKCTSGSLPSSSKSSEGREGRYSTKEEVVALASRAAPQNLDPQPVHSKLSFKVRVASRKNSIRRPSPLSKILYPESMEDKALDQSQVLPARAAPGESHIDAEGKPEKELVLTPTRKQPPSPGTEKEGNFTPESQQHSQPTRPLSPEAIQPASPSTPLIVLIYFTLELPRTSTDHRGSYLRHFAHPMRLPLSTNRHIQASVAHLRGYLTQQPARFLSHFSTTINGTTLPSLPKRKRGEERNRPQLLVNFPDLFASGRGGDVAERIWGPRLRFAWADASEERFAEAVVCMLREVAEGRVGKGLGGVLDLTCVVRQSMDGRGGYGLPVHVRRLVTKEPQQTQQPKRKAGRKERSGTRISIS